MSHLTFFYLKKLGWWVNTMLLKCPHCGHVWDYKGSQRYYTTCPVCQYKVNIRKNRINLTEEDEHGH